MAALFESRLVHHQPSSKVARRNLYIEPQREATSTKADHKGHTSTLALLSWRNCRSNLQVYSVPQKGTTKLRRANGTVNFQQPQPQPRHQLKPRALASTTPCGVGGIRRALHRGHASRSAPTLALPRWRCGSARLTSPLCASLKARALVSGLRPFMLCLPPPTPGPCRYAALALCAACPSAPQGGALRRRGNQGKRR